jgi:hypothetical protein
LIVRAPAAPVRELLARFGDGAEPDLDIHDFPLAARNDCVRSYWLATAAALTNRRSFDGSRG